MLAVWLVPRTVTLIVKCLVAIEVFGGSPSVAVAVPDEQRRVTGNPLTFGVTLNVHVWPPRTVAVIVTLPPLAFAGEGVILSEVTAGPPQAAPPDWPPQPLS